MFETSNGLGKLISLRLAWSFTYVYGYARYLLAVIAGHSDLLREILKRVKQISLQQLAYLLICKG